MSKFNPEDFMSSPDKGVFNALRKDELILLAKHLELESKQAMRKDEIRQIIVNHLVDTEVFEGTMLETSSKTMLEIKKLEMQEKREKEEREMQERLKREEMEMKREEMERQERLKREEMERQERLEKEKLAFQYEMEMKKLELQMKLGLSSDSEKHSEKFDVTKNIRLVPPFQEKDADKYFLHFEKVASSLKWPKEYWVMLLQSVLVGKAREIYTQLSVEQAVSYDEVKDLILKGYELVPEAYRQKFRNYEKVSSQTYVEFARSKEQLFDRWCYSQKVDKSHDKLRQLVLVEEFKRCIHSDVRTFINEQRAETLEDAARLADKFSLSHKVNFVEKPRQPDSRFQPPSASRWVGSQRSKQNDGAPPKRNPGNHFTNRSSSTSPGQNRFVLNKPIKPPTCYYCRKEGHLISSCPEKWRSAQKYGVESKPNGFVAKPSPSVSESECTPPRFSREKTQTISTNDVSGSSKSIMDMFQPFIHDGSVSLSRDMTDSVPIKILRDTGASQSLLLSDTLLFSEKSSTGASVLIRGISSEYTPVPLHTVFLSSDLVSGPVKVGVQPTLPFDGVHLILGNDLAGDKVVINAVVTEKPSSEKSPDPVEKIIPGLYPACVVTRAMSKKWKTSDEEIALADTLIS